MFVSGGQVSNTDGIIGRESGSMGSATVTGSGSQWNNSGFLAVGAAGNGMLNIEAGGQGQHFGWLYRRRGRFDGDRDGDRYGQPVDNRAFWLWVIPATGR